MSSTHRCSQIHNGSWVKKTTSIALRFECACLAIKIRNSGAATAANPLPIGAVEANVHAAEAIAANTNNHLFIISPRSRSGLKFHFGGPYEQQRNPRNRNQARIRHAGIPPATSD